MEKNKLSIIKQLFETKDIINYSPESKIEVTPSFFSPIFINIKQTISNPKLRQKIIKELVKMINPTCDYICGIESGGSYFASSIAEILNKPLILLRKETKKYGDQKRIIGKTPPSNSHLILIDDVLAKGLTLANATWYLKNLSYQIESVNVFSYGFDSYFGNHLKINIKSYINFNNLLSFGLKHKQFTKTDTLFLLRHTKHYLDIFKKAQLE